MNEIEQSHKKHTINKMSRLKLKLPSLPHPPSLKQTALQLKTPIINKPDPIRAFSISRNASRIEDNSMSATKASTSTSFCIGITKLRKGSTNYKSRSRMATINSKEATEPYMCMDSITSCKKYKVIERKQEIPDVSTADVIETINKQLYQCRYTIYINNHNILNNIKSFVAEHIGDLHSEQLPVLLKLINYYTDAITKEESIK